MPTTDSEEDLVTAEDLIKELEDLMKPERKSQKEIASTLAELFTDLSDDLVNPALIKRVTPIVEFVNKQPSLWETQVEHEDFKEITLFIAFIIFLCYPTTIFFYVNLQISLSPITYVL